MATKIKNNRLSGVLSNGKKWKVKTSIMPHSILGAFYLCVYVFIDENLQHNVTLTFKTSNLFENSINLPTYAEVSEKLLKDTENLLGVEILTKVKNVA